MDSTPFDIRSRVAGILSNDKAPVNDRIGYTKPDQLYNRNTISEEGWMRGFSIPAGVWPWAFLYWAVSFS